jgi:hypothetical protein
VARPLAAVGPCIHSAKELPRADVLNTNLHREYNALYRATVYPYEVLEAGLGKTRIGWNGPRRGRRRLAFRAG